MTTVDLKCLWLKKVLFLQPKRNSRSDDEPKLDPISREE
jgi:hypothetical protein